MACFIGAIFMFVFIIGLSLLAMNFIFTNPYEKQTFMEKMRDNRYY